ncbi:MAG: OmpA family protein [Bacteroidales bacterium]|jgi:outer membrane protein OmpA-like peptidoglycan-associated protein|nr:OmpA family protein [Bacteroidales bacterium]
MKNFQIKKLLFLFACVFVTAPLVAQHQNSYSTTPGRITTFNTNGFWDNWFVGAGAGANVYIGDGNTGDGLGGIISATPVLQAGKWLYPYLGGRLKIAGLTNINFFDKGTQKYLSLEANVLWDVSNFVLNYNAQRLYHFIPYAGIGWAYGWDYKIPSRVNASPTAHQNSITVDGGLINRFRVAQNINIDIELSGKLLKEGFNQRSGGVGYDILTTVSLGVIFDIGSCTTFTEAILRDEMEIDYLNSRINEQNKVIQSLAQQKQQKPEPQVIVKEVPVFVEQEPVQNVVLFTIGSAKIQSGQELAIYNVARYLQGNSSKRVRVVGYTDKATGTAVSNEKLSKQRAENVMKILIDKYSIDKERISLDWEGQWNSPFDVPEWNRAVILFIE